MIPVSTPDTTADAEVARVAALLASSPQAAALAAQDLLVRTGDGRAAMLLAAARRRSGDLVGARSVLETLALSAPGQAPVQFALGSILVELGDKEAAILAFEQATKADPNLSAARHGLDVLLAEKGAGVRTGSGARIAAYQLLLDRAAAALAVNQPEQAERLARSRLEQAPSDGEATFILGKALMAQGRTDEALGALAAARQAFPGRAEAQYHHAHALALVGHPAEARVILEPLHAADPQNPAYRNTLAMALAMLGDHEAAERLFAGLIRDFPDVPHLWVQRGHVLRFIGKRDDAMAAYRMGKMLQPSLGEAYWSLANLKLSALTDQEVRDIQAQLQDVQVRPLDRIHLHYALGAALEERGDHGPSFEHYAKGAALRRAQLPYSADAFRAQVDDARAAFTASFLETRGQEERPAEGGPIFVVGLPRSGSSLVQQILASHPSIEGLDELPYLGQIVGALSAKDLSALGGEELKALGQRYLDACRPHRHQDRPWFVDKTPQNFLHTGLILAALPGARIIDVRRHPMAGCFSAFKQLTAGGFDFSYDLTDLGRYYGDYADLMGHFNQAAPGRIHRVIYEDLVDDVQGETRRLLAFCGLDFDPACLTFYENRRGVQTPSSEQVRRPIFRQGLEQWRSFEPWLGRLKAALGPRLEAWRD